MKVATSTSNEKRPRRMPSSKSSPGIRGKRGASAKTSNGGARKQRVPSAGVVVPAPKSPQAAALPFHSDDPIKQALGTRVLRAITDALHGATPASLRHALEAPTDAGSAAQLLSLGVNLNEAVATLDPTVPAVIRGVAMKRDLLEHAGGVLNTARVAALLGISSQAVVKRVRGGTLLALTDASGHLQFPMIQFTDAGTVAGLKEVLAAFNVESPWTRLAVLLDTDDGLGGRRVIDALRAGALEAVLDVVRSFGA